MGNLWSYLRSGQSNHEVIEPRTYPQNSDVFQSRFDKLVNCVGPTVGDVARKAFSKKLIDLSALEAALNQHHDTKDRTTRLLSAILCKIYERDDNFNTFIEILEEIPTCKDMACELAACAQQKGT